MKFRYLFYLGMTAGFVTALGIYWVLSSREKAPTFVLGSQDVEVVSQETARLGGTTGEYSTTTFHSDRGGYSISIDSTWNVDTSDPTLVLISPPDGSYRALIDVVPDGLKSSDRMKRIEELKNTQSEPLVRVSDLPTKIGEGSLYTDHGYYFTETITNAEGVWRDLSLFITHNGQPYILTLSHVKEDAISKLKALHVSVFSSFVFDGSPQSCTDGLVPFQYEGVRFCRPSNVRMDKSEFPGRYVFTSDKERFLVEPSSSQTWPIHLCNLNQDIEVAGQKAVRTIFREDTGSGCGNIIGFGTKIGPADKPWFVGLLSEKDPYPDDTLFTRIERSLTIP